MPMSSASTFSLISGSSGVTENPQVGKAALDLLRGAVHDQLERCIGQRAGIRKLAKAPPAKREARVAAIRGVLHEERDEPPSPRASPRVRRSMIFGPATSSPRRIC
jgi:hypothetical protein